MQRLHTGRIEIPILCHLRVFVAKIPNSESGIVGHKKAQMTQNRYFDAGVHSLRATAISWRDGVSDAVHRFDGTADHSACRGR